MLINTNLKPFGVLASIDIVVSVRMLFTFSTVLRWQSNICFKIVAVICNVLYIIFTSMGTSMPLLSV